MRLHLVSNGPQGGSDLTCDGDNNNGVAFALRSHATKPGTQARLCLPGDVSHRLLRQIFLATLMIDAKTSATVVGPACFHDRFPRAAVACLDDPALASALTGGPL